MTEYRPPRRANWWQLGWLLGLLMVGGWLMSLVGVVFWESRDEARTASAIVVLGAAQYAGRPSPVLRARVDHAVDLWKRGLAPKMIVTGGFNVFPREVEDVVAAHPAVAQVGVIGTPHEKFGEAVTAIVVLRSDASREEEAIARMTTEIQEMVKERKGSVQAPKQVIVADSLPLTALGKPDKKALRAQYWTGDRAVG